MKDSDVLNAAVLPASGKAVFPLANFWPTFIDFGNFHCLSSLLLLRMSLRKNSPSQCKVFK